MIILLDAMGGDNAPESIVNGCIDAINEKDGFNITLIGDKAAIKAIIDKRSCDAKRIEIYHTEDVVLTDDEPTKVFKSKRNSSIFTGFDLLKQNKGDAYISAGNSGALMVGSRFILGRIKGIDRPSMPAIVPTRQGKALIIDAGLNTECKPVNYQQFGIMGNLYMKCCFNIQDPKVGLINVGTEANKGGEVIRQSYKRLSESKLNFVGNIEGKDLPVGKVEVAVCDGFTGNVMLKLYEGMGTFVFSSLKEIFTESIFTKVSFLGMKKGFKAFARSLDPDENGGAPILGVNGLVIKSHGSSNNKTIKNVILNRAIPLIKSNITEKISEELKNIDV